VEIVDIVKIGSNIIAGVPIDTNFGMEIEWYVIDQTHLDNLSKLESSYQEYLEKNCTEIAPIIGV